MMYATRVKRLLQHISMANRRMSKLGAALRVRGVVFVVLWGAAVRQRASAAFSCRSRSRPASFSRAASAAGTGAPE